MVPEVGCKATSSSEWYLGQANVRSNDMEHLRQPESLRLTADVGRNWKRFRQQFEFFLQATVCKANPRSEAAKTALFLGVAGEAALDVSNNFVFSGEENKEDYNTVIAKFEEYCMEQQNEMHQRYVSRSRSQGSAPRECKIALHKDAVPVIQPARSVPLFL
ncbi:uncharacterized protein [Dermacentor albipictus]|uniref:uncharacterized protein n=1 Tax=Dermacentor albipictus TaxID=60249 RepID=UPI0038FC2696